MTFCTDHYPDDPTIPDEADLLRRIPPRHFYLDQNLGRIRPSSAAFEDDDDEDPMSVYLSTVLKAENRAIHGTRRSRGVRARLDHSWTSEGVRANSPS
jgi:hypothetical protein